MKRTPALRGISRIDQAHNGTHGWFVRAQYVEDHRGRRLPAHRKFFGDKSHGGWHGALAAAKAYRDIVLPKVKR